MNIESQVTSLELSKRLKELDVEQKNLFYWREWIPPKGSTFIRDPWHLSFYKGEEGKHNLLSAFTVAELLDMLPHIINGKNLVVDRPFRNRWRVYFNSLDPENDYHLHLRWNSTLANAVAETVISYLESGLMKND